MSDINYAHEYSPRRRDGLCKTIVRSGSCHQPENALVHVRWSVIERQLTNSEHVEMQSKINEMTRIMAEEQLAYDDPPVDCVCPKCRNAREIISLLDKLK